MLDNKSVFPGRWKNYNTPYLVEIMDEMCNPYTQKIIFAKPTQVGGTEALINILGWSIMNDPSTMIIAYPTDELAEAAGGGRLQDLIDNCTELRELYIADKSRRLLKIFKGVELYIRSAGSPAKLASIAAKKVFIDESDKFPSAQKKEGSPFDLLEERTKTFQFSKKIYDNCTPTYESEHIWQAKEKADVEKHYFVPCPNCGDEIELEFKQIRFESNKELTNAERAATAMYHCQLCGGAIEDTIKPSMLRKGRWKIVQWRIGSIQRPRSVAFWLNSLYSPFVTWREIAEKWLEAQDDSGKLQNFVNSWLAEPWHFNSRRLNRDIIIEKSSGYDEGVVPNETLIITGGVDVQKDRFFYTIRAWGEGAASWNIRHGMAETWGEIERAMNYPYKSASGEEFFVNLCAIDSGYNSDEVYDFCYQNSEWAVPIKGSNQPLLHKYRPSVIDRNSRGQPNIVLYMVSGNYYKTFISNRLAREEDQSGGWYVYNNCDAEYAEQLCSEEQRVEERYGKRVETWVPKSTHANNHYWDAEVYAAFAADKLGIRDMLKQEPAAPKTLEKPKPKEVNWVEIEGGWISGY